VVAEAVLVQVQVADKVAQVFLVAVVEKVLQEELEELVALDL
jgi:hypothetical protein